MASAHTESQYSSETEEERKWKQTIVLFRITRLPQENCPHTERQEGCYLFSGRQPLRENVSLRSRTQFTFRNTDKKILLRLFCIISTRILHAFIVDMFVSHSKVTVLEVMDNRTKDLSGMQCSAGVQPYSPVWHSSRAYYPSKHRADNWIQRTVTCSVDYQPIAMFCRGQGHHPTNVLTACLRNVEWN